VSQGSEETVRLVRAAQSGDQRSIEALFERYLPRVRQIVALRLGYRTRDFAVHDDLVQEALVRAFRGLDRYEERSEGTFRNWVATCVANTVRNWFRDEKAARRGGGRAGGDQPAWPRAVR